MEAREKLVVGVLGNRDSGKTTTWRKLFGYRIGRTRTNVPWLELRPGQWLKTIVIDGSPEEAELNLEEYLDEQQHRVTQCECLVVLCSMQYQNNFSLDYFIDHDYTLYIQWINPGFQQKEFREDPSIIKKILDANSVLSIRDGKDLERRVQDIKEFIYGWAKYRHPRFS